MNNFYSRRLTDRQIRNIPFFEDFPIEAIIKLQEILFVEEYNPCEYIFSEGQEAVKMYFLLQGSVRIIKRTAKGNLENICELQAPEFFGEMAFVDRGPRSAGVLVVNRSYVAELEWSKFLSTFTTKPEIAIYTYKKIASALSMKLRKANAKYAHLIP